MPRCCVSALLAALCLAVLDTPASALEKQRASVLYRADAAHGWAGWKAPGWRVRHGELVADGPAGEIRAPYVPGRHHIRNYRVTVTVGSVAAKSDSGQELDIEVRRVGPGGYMLSALGCQDDAGDCLELSDLGSKNELYKRTSYPDDGYPILPGLTLKMTVRGNSITAWRQDNPDEYLMLHGHNSEFPHGGFVALYNPIDNQRLSIRRVTIAAL
jgi:hypothetical protein